MLAYLPLLILLGLILFIVRAQLLRIGIAEFGDENLHSSRLLGVISGWSGLAGAALLACVAFVYGGIVWGLVLVTGGMILGIVASAVFLAMLRSTSAFGYHGGEGDKSVAEFNRRYGAALALAVAGIAAICVYAVFSIALHISD